jgi:[ribosomal protein S5]-alanine N-acetyltransferase
MEPFTITTARLELRPFRADDVADVLVYASDEDFGRYVPTVPYPYGPQDAETFVARATATDWSTVPTFAVVLAGEVIGASNLEVDRGAAMLGYAIGSRWWGRGLGTEIAEAVTGRAFQDYDAVVVWATTDARNVASRRVLDKVGMRLGQHAPLGRRRELRPPVPVAAVDVRVAVGEEVSERRRLLGELVPAAWGSGSKADTSMPPSTPARRPATYPSTSTLGSTSPLRRMTSCR